MALSNTHAPMRGPQVEEHVPAGQQIETPVHPLSSMQGAFEESILESMEEAEMPSEPIEADAHARRHRLLESEVYDDSWTARWNQRSTAKHHPLLKLMAQIIFGMHLLQQQQARSDKEVVKILQTHVNEVDTFLERTADDFTVAIRDAEDRIRCLKLPMTHLDVFETMLGDQKFRSQLLAGNEKIERIIERTKRAMKACLLDIDVGVQANRELHRFLKKVQDRWPQDQPAIADVFGAMRGNGHGWKRYLRDLQNKGTVLAGHLMSLQKLIDDMAKMAEAAKTNPKPPPAAASPTTAAATAATAAASSVPSTPALGSKSPTESSVTRTNVVSPTQATTNLNKPLPLQPPPKDSIAQETAPKLYPGSIADRYERQRQSPAESSPRPYATTAAAILHPRPRTAGDSKPAPRAVDDRASASKIGDIMPRPDPLRSNPNPLRSNPPDESSTLPRRPSVESRKSARSPNPAANLIMGTVSVNPNGETKVTRAVDVVTAGNSMDLSRKSMQQDTRSISSHGAQNSIGNGRAPSMTGDADDAAERRAAMKDTGFARRLSKRLKHLPLDMDEPPLPSPGLPLSMHIPPVPYSSSTMPSRTPQSYQPSPPDSAYSSVRRESPPIDMAALNKLRTTKVPRPVSSLGSLPYAGAKGPTLRGGVGGGGVLQYSSRTGAERMGSGRPAPAAGSTGAAFGTGLGNDSAISVASGKSRGSAFRSLFKSKFRTKGLAV